MPAEDLPRPAPLPRAIIVMGVSGSGKSTVASLLAQRLDWPFLEGDDLHPIANIEKMKAGHPLTDDDRWPWLQRIAEAIETARKTEGHLVVACSALKRAYRDLIAGHHNDVVVVYLKGRRETIAQRLDDRQGHFMPPGLLDSQFADLEEPTPPERAIAISIEPAPDIIAQAIVAALASDLV